MYLNPKNIAFYLFEKGLLSWEESLAGVQHYLEAGSRSFGFKVEMVCGKNFFIKQIKNNFDGMSRLLEMEALVLQAENFTEKPTFFLYDKKNGILVNSLVDNAQNLGEFIKNEGFLLPIATQLGLVLSKFHQVEFKENHFQNSSQRQHPLVFYLGTAAGRNFLKQKRERFTTQLIEQIALYPSLLEAIAEAHKNWEAKTLIHGDMKFENCLIQKMEDSYKMQLIDFEEVTMGDALWDVAGIVQAAISVQLQKTHFLIFSPFSPFHPLLDDAIFCDWLQTFWKNYELDNKVEVNEVKLIGSIKDSPPNLTPDPSPAERGAVCPRLTPLSAGEGSGVRFGEEPLSYDKFFTVQKLIQFTGLRLIGRLMEIAQQVDVSHQAKEWLPLAQEMIENPEKYLKLLTT